MFGAVMASSSGGGANKNASSATRHTLSRLIALWRERNVLDATCCASCDEALLAAANDATPMAPIAMSSMPDQLMSQLQYGATMQQPPQFVSMQQSQPLPQQFAAQTQPPMPQTLLHNGSVNVFNAPNVGYGNVAMSNDSFQPQYQGQPMPRYGSFEAQEMSHQQQPHQMLAHRQQLQAGGFAGDDHHYGAPSSGNAAPSSSRRGRWDSAGPPSLAPPGVSAAPPGNQQLHPPIPPSFPPVSAMQPAQPPYASGWNHHHQQQQQGPYLPPIATPLAPPVPPSVPYPFPSPPQQQPQTAAYAYPPQNHLLQQPTLAPMGGADNSSSSSSSSSSRAVKEEPNTPLIRADDSRPVKPPPPPSGSGISGPDLLKMAPGMLATLVKAAQKAAAASATGGVAVPPGGYKPSSSSALPAYAPIDPLSAVAQGAFSSAAHVEPGRVAVRLAQFTEAAAKLRAVHEEKRRRRRRRMMMRAGGGKEDYEEDADKHESSPPAPLTEEEEERLMLAEMDRKRRVDESPTADVGGGEGGAFAWSKGRRVGRSRSRSRSTSPGGRRRERDRRREAYPHNWAEAIGRRAAAAGLAVPGMASISDEPAGAAESYDDGPYAGIGLDAAGSSSSSSSSFSRRKLGGGREDGDAPPFAGLGFS